MLMLFLFGPGASVGYESSAEACDDTRTFLQIATVNSAAYECPLSQDRLPEQNILPDGECIFAAWSSPIRFPHSCMEVSIAELIPDLRYGEMQYQAWGRLFSLVSVHNHSGLAPPSVLSC